MSVALNGAIAHATTTSANSLACNKPASTASGNLLVAHVSSNDGAITSSGWTVLAKGDGNQPDLFDHTVLYKVAGGSEPSTYTFTNASGTAPPIVVTVAAYSGVNTGNPFGGHTTPFVGAGALTEGVSTGTCTNTGNGLPIYFRGARVASSSIPSFTNASSLTEVDDTGVFSGGTVSYGHCIMLGAAETASNPTAVTVTASATETDNVYGVYVLNNANVSVTAGVATATADPLDAVGQVANIGSAVTATATATAQQPTVLTGTVAPAGVATATAAANDIGMSNAVRGVETPNATAAAYSAGVYYGAPPGRTVVVGAESRTYSPDAESRVYTVQILGSD